jgi:uncharacterized protein YjbJ (UPF0337 family)
VIYWFRGRIADLWLRQDHFYSEAVDDESELETDEKADQVKGRVEEVVGAATGDKELQHDGTVDRMAGEVKERMSGATKQGKKLVDRIKDALHKK